MYRQIERMNPSEYFITLINNFKDLLLSFRERSWWDRFYNSCAQISFGFAFIETVLLILGVLLLLALVMRTFLRRKASLQSFGNLPRTDLKNLKDIVIEVHFAACHCGSDRSLVQRCRSLLEVYPAACNIKMYGHDYTPFLRACWNGCTELIVYMIQIGADIEVTTDAGEGAIYLATYCAIRMKSNDFSAIKVLLAAGLDINQGRGDGLTPLDVATLKKHSRLQRWLIARGAKPTYYRYNKK